MDAIYSSIEEQILDFNHDLSRLDLVIEDPDRATQADLWLCADNEDFHDFLDLVDTTTRQPDIDHQNECNFMSPIDLDWDDVFSSQNVTDLDQSKHHDQMNLVSSANADLRSLGNNGISDVQSQFPAHSFHFGEDTESATQPGLTFKDLEIPESQPPLECPQFSLDLSPFQPVPRGSTDYTLGKTSLCKTFEKLGIQQYLDIFLQQGFDTWKAVLDITESDLDAMGVKLGHRRKLQREIFEFKLCSCDSYSSINGYPTLQDSQKPGFEAKSPPSDILNAVLKGTPCVDEADSSTWMRPLAESNAQKTDSIPCMLAATNPPKSELPSINTGKSNKSKSRITKFFGRRRSTQEESYPGYQVWDSRSAKSASSSISSAASGRSATSIGRKSALSGTARAMANAVKAVKACWRCKFMRKPCEVELPCKSCPKGLNGKTKFSSAWVRVGCRRGNLEDEMQEIRLCPVWSLNLPGFDMSYGGGNSHSTVNYSCEENYQRRQKALSQILDKDDFSLLDARSRTRYLITVDGDDEETLYHPIVCEYLNKVVDFELLVERLKNTLDMKRSLEDLKARLLHDGGNLCPDDQQWLEKAPNLVAEVSQLKLTMGMELETIKQDCRSRGLIDMDGDPIDFQMTEVATLDDITAWVQDLKSVHSELKLACGSDEFLLRTLAPLRACVIYILWDLKVCPRLQNVLRPIPGSSHMTLETFEFFRSAADYQRSVKDNELITLSLICLRTCLESLRVHPTSMSPGSHQVCTYTHCLVQCIQNLEAYLKCFLEELSTVFFKKDNLRSRSWWLSAFYAFSIQSMVRAGLQILVDAKSDGTVRPNDGQWSAVQNYLSVALHLFIATSSTYDPLMSDYSIALTSISKTEEEKVSDQHFKAAQLALKQSTWKSQGIANSMQYLQNLFEDGR